ncbi:uncharacterized protein K444DRAFT_624327 [Hyaloscypha bicolor E]|uniref:Methyltransferase type 11 domain-containing protein n=1 Tax=Hyaloscypha bicolor E TaxID=1095630 RepID=A0A2J6TRY4_9HELO|nr:uncharacterized protein K444DRAFT_624327 [Hyaloscypha bicolor E]PMD65774.1 hypothetical protein K444DRAFT_624327 [Hyaloscypha bicolor E]
MAETDIHPLQTSVANDTKVSSYNKHIGSKLGDPARRLLETYSKISSDEIEKHVYAIGAASDKISADGAPSEHLYGSDLRPEFFELGYKLFRDEDTLQSNFIVGDVFDPSPPLSALDGKIDIIYAASFLRLFGYEDQIRVCKRIVNLLKEKKDSVVLGRQVGNANAGERPRRNGPTKARRRHNEESFKKMWEEVGNLTESRWRMGHGAGMIRPCFD